MRKLTLDAEALAVISFATSDKASGRGTAHAHSINGIVGSDESVRPDTGGGADGPTQDYGLATASCTQCDTCNGAGC